jgi:hypothetical protein
VVEWRSGSAFLDLSSVPDGAYFLTVHAGGARSHGRFMKVNN